MMKLGSREPNFNNMIDVLERRVPQRPVLFELFMNNNLYTDLTGRDDGWKNPETLTKAFYNAGYDYVSMHASAFEFVNTEHDRNKLNTISLNDSHHIHDRESFDKFQWNNPDDYSMEKYESVKDVLPKGMKVIPFGPCGVLENVIALVGYDNLCMMIYDDEQLVYDIFEKVGSSLVKYYERAVKYDFVGAMISNDDWGFNTQPMLSPTDMRRFVFPWHKKLVQVAHDAGKYAILHSCGNYSSIIDDVIDDMKYDARHSYEDNIEAVEIAYPKLRDRIAVLGGVDIGFMISSSPDEIYERSKKLVEEGMKYGAYALGTGNSVPEFVSNEHYYAMIKAAWDYK